MGLRMNVLAGMDALPFFSYGESYLLEALKRRSPFDHGGMKPQWDLFDSVWDGVTGYLISSFPTLERDERRIYCQLRTSKLREMIEANERGCEFTIALTKRLEDQQNGANS
jgi:hypothetical protein